MINKFQPSEKYMDRRIILAAVLLIGILVSYDLDPLKIKYREAVKANPGANMVTGLFAASGSDAAILPGVFFMLLIGLIFVLRQKQKEEKESENQG